mmetsp:Transcript_6933/g.18582  ORF Transcript_6933/g.18582 Transcript_6933/m.18582 type:complete len:94 (-) Transcript_6933:204-485(-)
MSIMMEGANCARFACNLSLSKLADTLARAPAPSSSVLTAGSDARRVRQQRPPCSQACAAPQRPQMRIARAQLAADSGALQITGSPSDEETKSQ